MYFQIHIIMRKKLEDMTLEELWELFPIVLVPYRPEWREWALDEIAILSELLSEYSPKISHIGSTAIPQICSKSIVDILVEIQLEPNRAGVKDCMESAGYICMSDSGNRISFNKGYTVDGYAERVYHIHFHDHGDHNEIYFRDYLLANHEVAKEYESLKLLLAERYRHDRDGYTEAKTEFIERILANTVKK